MDMEFYFDEFILYLCVIKKIYFKVEIREFVMCKKCLN